MNKFQDSFTETLDILRNNLKLFETQIQVLNQEFKKKNLNIIEKENILKKERDELASYKNVSVVNSLNKKVEDLQNENILIKNLEIKYEKTHLDQIQKVSIDPNHFSIVSSPIMFHLINKYIQNIQNINFVSGRHPHTIRVSIYKTQHHDRDLPNPVP